MSEVEVITSLKAVGCYTALERTEGRASDTVGFDNAGFSWLGFCPTRLSSSELLESQVDKYVFANHKLFPALSKENLELELWSKEVTLEETDASL